MTAIRALLAGLLFGIVLMISGMANPAKVLGFIDLAGTCDPSLAFVMVGAIAVGTVAFIVAKRRMRSFLGLPVQLAASTTVTTRRHGPRRSGLHGGRVDGRVLLSCLHFVC